MSAVLYAACCMNRALMVPEAAPPLLGLFSLEQAARAATPAEAPLPFRKPRRVSGLGRPTPFVVIATLSPSVRVCRAHVAGRGPFVGLGRRERDQEGCEGIESVFDAFSASE